MTSLSLPPAPAMRISVTRNGSSSHPASSNSTMRPTPAPPPARLCTHRKQRRACRRRSRARQGWIGSGLQTLRAADYGSRSLNIRPPTSSRVPGFIAGRPLLELHAPGCRRGGSARSPPLAPDFRQRGNQMIDMFIRMLRCRDEAQAFSPMRGRGIFDQLDIDAEPQQQLV
jgi:hypothetical protein